MVWGKSREAERLFSGQCSHGTAGRRLAVAPPRENVPVPDRRVMDAAADPVLLLESPQKSVPAERHPSCVQAAHIEVAPVTRLDPGGTDDLLHPFQLPVQLAEDLKAVSSMAFWVASQSMVQQT